MRFYQSTIFFLSAVASLFGSTVGQNDESAAVFISSLRSSSGNVTFALSVADPKVSQDVYLHISGPSSYSYIGIGTGTVMQGSLIFVIYSNATGDGQFIIIHLRIFADILSLLKELLSVPE